MMKKIFPCLLALALLPTGVAAGVNENAITAFGVISDMEPEQNGAGAGMSAQFEWQENVFLDGRFLLGTYDDFDRAQLLLGGEWVDQVGKVAGYLGAHVGADIFDDEDVTVDAFARLHYDVGFAATRGSWMRVGVAYDIKSSKRQGGLRLSWESRDVDFGYFLSGEFYEDEKNLFAGVRWRY